MKRISFEEWIKTNYPNYEDDCDIGYHNELCPSCNVYGSHCVKCDDWGSRYAYDIRKEYTEQLIRDSGVRVDVGTKNLPLFQ